MADFLATFKKFIILNLVPYNKEANGDPLPSCIKYISQRERQRNMTMLQYGQYKLELVGFFVCLFWRRGWEGIGSECDLGVFMKLLNNKILCWGKSHQVDK